MRTLTISGRVISPAATVQEVITRQVGYVADGEDSIQLRRDRLSVVVEIDGIRYSPLLDGLQIIGLRPVVVLHLDDYQGAWAYVTITPSSNYTTWDLGSQLLVVGIGKRVLPSQIWAGVGY